jgi:hypothetical protein
MSDILDKIINRFKAIPDHKVQGRLSYKQYEILTIVFIGFISGCKGWMDI